MKGSFRAITQVCFALLLALSLSLVPAVSALATELPSISPTTGEYDLDDPTEVMTAITWGVATLIDAIIDDDGYRLQQDEDYAVYPRNLIILPTYLEDRLTDIGDELELSISFDVGDAEFTITAIGTQPSISHPTRGYDLEDRDDVTTIITWGAANKVESITENGSPLRMRDDYEVGTIAAGKAALTILNTYLADELEDIGDSVELTIEFDRGDPVTFEITATGTDASISPQTREYKLDEPAEVRTTITWGSATKVDSIVDGDAYELLPDEYTRTDIDDNRSTLTIKNSYLARKLNDIGDSVVLTIDFDVGNDVTFTITADGTQPRLSPPTVEYDLDAPAEVKTTIRWGAAGKIESIVDGDGHELLTPRLFRSGDYTLTRIDAERETLTVNRSYLTRKLKNIGDSVVLTIGFDVGNDVTFTITADGTQPRLSPPTVEYDLDAPADVTATITWGAAGKIESFVDGDGYELLTARLFRSGDYALATLDAERETLTVNRSYLTRKLKDIGDSVELTIEFDVGNDATITITADGTQPRLSPPTEEYDLDAPADVTATITWGAAGKVESIVDGDDYELVRNEHYTSTRIDAEREILTIKNSYLARKLKDIRESVVLTIDFDVGTDATFVITTEGTQPRLSPPTEEYDLDAPADVETSIKLGAGTEVKSIVDDDVYKLQKGVDYSLDDDTATLMIFHDPYLKRTLKDVGAQVVLTIDFDVGPDATFTITAGGTPPTVSPPTVDYDCAAPADVETTIWFGSAKTVVSIVDEEKVELVEDVHYGLTRIDDETTKLTIFDDPYLKAEHPDIGESVVLTIEFDVNEVLFTITAIGTRPTISPTTAEYGIAARNNVSTNITWGSAASIVSIVDGADFELIEDEHYTVTPINDDKATLTILSEEYLGEKLRRIQREVVLTVDFDVSSGHDFTVRTIRECFIATAAHGTPMAAEIEVLREFRDEYMLTNPVGEALVNLYYRASPPIALFITVHPSLQPVVRAALSPAVTMSAVVVNTTPAQKTAIVIALALASAAMAIWATRRRTRHPEYS